MLAGSLFDPQLLCSKLGIQLQEIFHLSQELCDESGDFSQEQVASKLLTELSQVCAETASRLTRLRTDSIRQVSERSNEIESICRELGCGSILSNVMAQRFTLPDRRRALEHVAVVLRYEVSIRREVAKQKASAVIAMSNALKQPPATMVLRTDRSRRFTSRG